MQALFAANHEIELRSVANHLLQQLASLPMVVSVGLRRPLEGNPAAFEILTAELCATLGIDVRWYQPEPNLGRSGTQQRMWRMVEAADKAILYFYGSPHGGTGLLLEGVLSAGIPIEAFTLEEDEVHDLGSLASSDL